MRNTNWKTLTHWLAPLREQRPLTAPFEAISSFQE